MSLGPEIKQGTYTGTGAAINISLGFVPTAVIVKNSTDRDLTVLWTSTNANGTADALVGSNVDSNGITPYAGTETAAPGFTVGTGLSENAKVFDWIAIKAGL